MAKETFNINAYSEYIEGYEVEAESLDEALDMVMHGEVDSHGWEQGEPIKYTQTVADVVDLGDGRKSTRMIEQDI